MSLFGPPNIEKLKSRNDVLGLIKALQYKRNTSVRRAAAEALGQIRNVRAVEPLVDALKDNQYEVWAEAARALVQIRDAKAVEPLVAMLKGNRGREAAKALGQIGDVRAVKPLITALQDEDSLMRDYAADALGQIGDSQAIEPLRAALNDKIGTVWQAAAKALGKIGDTGVIESFVKTLKQRDLEWATAEALGIILEHVVAKVATDDLHVIAAQVDDIRYETEWFEVQQETIQRKVVTVDYSKARALAQQELIRRGVKV